MITLKEKIKRDFEKFLKEADDKYLQKIFLKEKHEEYYIEEAMNKIQESYIVKQNERMNMRRIINLLEKDLEEATKEIEGITVDYYESPSDSDPDEPQNWNTTERWTRIKELIRQKIKDLNQRNNQLKQTEEQIEFLIEENDSLKAILQEATIEVQQHLGLNADQLQNTEILRYLKELKEAIRGKHLIDFMISLTPKIPEDQTSDEDKEEETL